MKTNKQKFCKSGLMLLIGAGLFWAFASEMAFANLISAAPGITPSLGDVITITDAKGAQQFPDIAYNSKDNSYLIVWENVVDADTVEIQGVLADGVQGKPTGQPAVLLSAPVEFIEAPEITYNSVDNEFLLTARRRSDAMALAQRIDSKGKPVGDTVEIGKDGGPTFFDPAARARVVSVVFNAKDNRYFVGLGEVWAAILLPDLIIEATVDTVGMGSNPSVSWSSKSNTYIIAWEDRESRDTGAENLSAQIISGNGELIGEKLLLRDQLNAEESPRVAYNPDDDVFLVIWDERIGFSEGQPQTQTDTVGCTVSADGKKVSEIIYFEFTSGYTLRQDIDYNPATKEFLTVWKGNMDGEWAFAEIYGRFADQKGVLSSDPFLIYNGGDDKTADPNNEQYYDESKLPVVAANLKSGDYLVAWEEGGIKRNPEDRNIMARLIKIAPTAVNGWEIY